MLTSLYKMKNKKGFTLVELIVVLVILAILLAILVPALTKWIDKAKEKQVLVEARTVYLACQTVASEDYGLATPTYNTGVLFTADVTAAGVATGKADDATAKALEKKFGDAVGELADLTNAYTVACKIDANGRVSEFTYQNGSKKITLDKTNGSLVKG